MNVFNPVDFFICFNPIDELWIKLTYISYVVQRAEILLIDIPPIKLATWMESRGG